MSLKYPPHNRNRMTQVSIRKPTLNDWMKYRDGVPDEPTITTSDKFMFSGLAIDLTVLAGYYFKVLPEWAAWLGIGMAIGCIVVAVLDGMRREFNWTPSRALTAISAVSTTGSTPAAAPAKSR